MKTKYRVFLFLPVVALLLTMVLSFYSQSVIHPQANGVQPTTSPSAPLAGAASLKGASGTSSRPSNSVDHFVGIPVLDERVLPKKGIENRVNRLRLVKQADFKYPLIRVEDEVRIDAGGQERLLRQTAYVADHVMVRVQEGVTPEELEAALVGLGAKVRSRKPASGIWLVSFANPHLDTVSEALKAFADLPEKARYAEPDYIVHASVLPNDTSFSSLWGLHNTGQNSGTPDADIDAPEAWNLTTGSSNVLVGVIDTGIDHTHPDLAANMWTNPGEIAGNGIDDDGNGYIDDTRGWDFANNDNNPMDDNNHGTHCAGTIGGAGNNASGVAGVNWQVSLVGLKFLTGAGSGATSDAVEATAYATTIGVDMTSNSWGGGGFVQSLKDAIDAADTAGILFVAAAGNDSTNSDSLANYPSGYTSPNIIAVASTTRTDGLSSFSNYGATTVDLGAPGSDIYSTVAGGSYSTFSGTSMATPHVAGACALLKAYRPTLTHSEIKGLIMQSADAIPALAGKCITGGRLNVYNAMLFSSDVTMSPGGGLMASGPMGGPLSPTTLSYTLTNRDTQSAVWTASSNQPWMTISSAGGTLAAGATATLTVTLTSAVNQLPGGNHQGTLTVTNTTRGTSQTRTAVLDILPPVIVSETLDTDPGWPMTGQWAYGTPTGSGGVSHGYPDPTSGATGMKVLGVNLAGDYSIAPGGPWHVTAGPFDLSQYQATQLEYKRWLNIDGAFWVPATVQISNDNLAWTTIWSSSGQSENAWSAQRHVLGSVADGSAQVWVRWSYQVNNVADVWAFSGWNIDDITIRGVPVKNLALSLPAAITEGTAATTATLTVTPVPTSNQTVTLSSSDASQVTVPASVTVPAGQSSVTFQVTAVDDALADGTQAVSLTASSAGFTDRVVSLEVNDNETRVLTLSLPTSLAEGSGHITGQATMGLDLAADRDVRVFLSSSDPSELSVPTSVTIPAGQTSVALILTVPEDALIDGVQNVTVTATVQNWTTASTNCAITDNEALTLVVTLPSGLLEGSSAPQASVTLSGITPVAVAVSLGSSDTTEITVPASVNVPSGSSSVSFPVTIVDDGVVDSPQTVTLTASANGFTNGTAQTVVYDLQTPATPASPAPAIGATGVSPETDLAWGIASGTGGTPTSFDVYFGSNATPGVAELVGNVTTAAWTLPRLNPGSTYYWQIVSKVGSVTTSGPVWNFTVAPVGQPVRYTWSSIAPPQLVDVPFAATVTAYDAYDNIATPFNGSATVSTVRSTSSVVISEVEPNTPDAIEFVNVSSAAVDVSGWTVSIYDVDTWPSAKTFVFPAGSSCPASGVFRITENGLSPGTMPLFYYGSNINWTSDSSSTVAVLLRKPDGSIVDFMCAAAATPASITSPVTIPASEWTGSPVTAPTNTTYDYARQGLSDLNNASGWTTAFPGIGTLNPGLTVPFPGSGLDLPVLPQSITFASGVWTGNMRVRGAAVLTQLRAEDAQGRRGDSNAFTVTSLGLLSVTVSGSTFSEGAGIQSAAITVTLPAAAASAVTVTVTSSDASEATAGTVSIPAGQLSGTVDLTLVDDTGLDGTQQVVLEATALGYTPKTATIQVTDSETTTLTLAAPGSLGENAGLQTAQGSVSIPEAAVGDVLVALSSSDTSEITVPASVTIPAGQSTATFDFTVLQDALLDGAQNVTLTASVTNWTSGTAVVTVMDDETASVTLLADASTHEGAGTDPSIAVVTLGGVAVEAVTITLSSSDPGELSVPATVTISAGQSTTSIPGTVIDDTDLDGTQAVTLSAVAFGNAAVTGSVDVRDNDAASFSIGSISSPQLEGQPFQLTITARDINGLTLPAVAGTITQTVANGSGPLDYDYNAAATFVNGVWQQNVRVLEPATAARITVTGPQATALSNPFDVGMGPRIAVNPASYTLDIPRQSSKTRSLTITNNGALPLTWSMARPAWVTANPANGTVPAGGSANVSVTFSAASLAEGTTTGTLTITSNDVVAGPIAIPVTLNVTAPVASFVWNTVPSPQRVNDPFPVSVTAKDSTGATVTGFEGTVALSGGVGGAGTGGSLLNSPVPSSSYNFGTYTIGYSFTPTSNITVTDVRSYSGSKVSIWTNTGTLLASAPVIASGGSWSDTPLPSPLQLQAGVTYRIGVMTGGTSYYGRFDMSANFADGVLNQAYESLGDAFPSGVSSWRWIFVDLKYSIGTPVPVSPVTSGTFASGVWSGNVTVQQPVVNMALRASDGAGHSGESNTFDVQAVGTLGISLAASPISEGAGTLAGTVTVTPAPTADLAVTLSSSLNAAAVPSSATVTVLAGSTSAGFTLNIVDDALLDGPQTTQIGVVGPGYLAQSTPLVVADDEGAVLTINLASSSYSEASGAISGTITSDQPPTVPVTILLASDDTSEATVPASVTLAAGATSAPFTLTVVNDTLVDGDQTVVLTASVAGWASGTKNLTITDNEARTLTLMGLPVSISEGAPTLSSASVALSGQAAAPVEVTLTSSVPSALPSLTVTIPAGASSAVFDLDPVDDTLHDGTQNVTITATAATFTNGTASVAVLDDDVHHFVLSNVTGPKMEGVPFAFTATAEDINNVTITSVAGPVNLTAAGDSGSLSVLPSGPLSFSSGVWTGNVRVMSPGTNVKLTVTSPTAANESNAFDVGMGPRLAVNPTSLAMSVAQKFSKTRTVTLSNNGAATLNWTASLGNTLNPSLEDVLAGINARHAEITALIPNRFNFTEGETGTFIASGGGVHMYHSGNVLGTTLSPGAGIPYSNNAIVNASSFFGTGGRYFTLKQPGLFVLAADMSGVSEFNITGGTGNHYGLVEGSVLTAVRGSRTFKGFVKRARGDTSWNAESVNHLVIIENDASAAHSFSSTVDSDDHQVTGLSTRTRLYYLLYSAVNGGNVNDAATQAIFEKFMDVIGSGSWISMSPAAGTIAPGGSQDVAVTFGAGSLATGVYTDTANLISNDATTSPLAIPATMTVTPGVHHFDWDTIASPQIVNAPFSATIRAKDAANGLVADFEGSASLSALNTTAAQEITTGTGTGSTYVIHDTSYAVHRTQCIYNPAEVGSAGRLSGLALDVATLGSPAASNFIIRLKHTNRVDYAADTSWEGSGWTTVFTGGKTLATGLNYFTFSSPFDYDGASNLMVDISFVNGTYASASYCRYSTASASRTIYYGAYSGDPLLWSGTSTYAYATTALPNLRLVKSGVQAPLSPLVTGGFVSGIWTGDIRLGAAGTLEITATAADGSKGTSNTFTTTSTGTLTLSMPASFTEGQGTLANACTVTISAALASPLEVSLASLDTSEITLPASVVIPAGQTSVSFGITVVDDALLDGLIPVQASALAVGFPTVTASATVADNDSTTVTVTLPASLAEGYSSTAQGTVQLGMTASSNLVVTLASSLTSRVTVPASVTIPSGQNSATFTLTAVDNNIIDGSQTATITATLAGSSPGTSTIQVTDNESTALNLSVFYTSVSEGGTPLASAGYVYLSGTVTSALTINLASSDTTELTMPATVTIPAGSSQSGYFSLTPVNDTLKDGSQNIILKANAAGFITSTRAFTVTDDDVASFGVSSVASPQVLNGAFNVTFTARDINGVSIPSYAGSPSLTAADGTTSLAVTPMTVTGFSGGSKTQSVTVQGYATNAVLTLTDATIGANGSSNAFVVGVGNLHHFTWDSISSPKSAATPFTTTIQARDQYENLITGYNGVTQLAAYKNFSTTTSGTGTSVYDLPIYGYYSQSRSQMIYLPTEVGNVARALRSLSLNISGVGRGSYANLTIRLKHTSKSSFSGSALWEPTGWTTVFQGPLSLTGTGWKQIVFNTPFAYDGSSNLMVDFSSNLTTNSYTSTTAYSSNATNRGIYTTTSGYGDPLTWSGSSPTTYISNYLPNLRLESYELVPVTPNGTTAFTAGTWTGNVSLSTPGSTALVATDTPTGSKGVSNAFTLSSLGSLSLSLASTTVSEAAGTVTATLSLSSPLVTNIVVSLNSSMAAVASVPSSVTIPSGQTSVTFPVTIVQDTLLEGNQTTLISATLPGYDPGTATLTVQDDETATVTLSLPGTVSEATTTAQGTVQLSATAAADLTVSLTSSLNSRLTVPSTVVIPAGSNSVNFAITTLDNSTIDGAQSVTISATLAGSATATGTLQILDNENSNITVFLTQTSLSEGAPPVPSAGYISLSYTTSAAFTINLLSSDSSELTLPATVIIPAGSSQSNSFTLTPVNDTLKDGTQNVTLTASASGLTTGTRTITITDDDVASFGVSTIPSPQIRNGPFNVTFTARDINGVSILNYTGTPSLTAADGGTALAVSPANVGSFFSGSRTVPVTMGAFATNAVLTLTDAAAGATGVSNAFVVGTGALSKFGWSSIPSPQVVGMNFPVTLTAQDSAGNTITTFNGAADISLPISIGTGTSDTTWNLPLYTFFEDSRTQVIYTAAELGASASINSLALNITAAPGQIMNNFTIRMRHTTKANYTSGGASWESTDWTTCYMANQTISSTGWNTFQFTTPFEYNGTNNVMIDISFNNNSFTSAGAVVATQGVAVLSIHGASDSANGDPLAWTGAGNPTPLTSTMRPDIRLTSAAATVSPSITGTFTAGMWSGNIAITAPSSQTLRLTATQAAITSQSAPFELLGTSLAITAEPAFTGGLSNSLSWNQPATGLEYQIERSTTPDFATPVSSAFQSTVNTSYSGLIDGQAYHYRVRMRRGATWTSAWSPVVTSTQDATPPLLTAPQYTTSAATATLTGTASDGISGVASVTAAGNTASSSNAFANWTAALSGLSDGPNSISVTAADNAVPPNTTTLTTTVFRIAAPSGDPDGNGVNSLLEHALGIPAGTSPYPYALLPAASIQTETVSNQRFLELVYRRRIQRAGLTYVVETSADLLTWDDTGASVVEKSAVPTGDGTTETVTVRVTPSVDLVGAKFVRLRVTTN